ncbi:MAG TPA: hypothetical protein VEB64_14205 [Azospirillaceae bacterium]|nr:hypothetical protein [Azospirillaceae bacterium]
MTHKTLAAALITAILLTTGGVQAQDMMGHGTHHGGMPAGTIPTLPGQDAFGAIQEIVGILEADPATDWSKVDIEALRRHLIDMNEVTLNAETKPEPIDGGVRITVTGNGRTLGAIRRMVADHGHEVNGPKGWTAATEAIPDGATLTVTSADPVEAVKIRALGFMGIMVQSDHHQAHHLAMAKGEFTH